MQMKKFSLIFQSFSGPIALETYLKKKKKKKKIIDPFYHESRSTP